MENTLENKAKFFAHFWGQKVMRCKTFNATTGHGLSGLMNVDVNSETIKENWFLELNPLSSISGEDAIEVAKIIEPYFAINNKGLGRDFKIKVSRDSRVIRVTKADFKVSIAHSYVHDDTVNIMTWQGTKETRLYPTTFLHAFDYLRSRGYALPFMGLPVEELVNRGWVKLKGE